MKKLLMLCLAALMLFGCTKKTPQATTPEATEAKQNLTVGICVRQYDADGAYYEKLKSLLQQEGYTVIVSDGKNDQSRQDSQVKNLIADGCSMLLLEPVMVSALDTVMESVKTANIPVLFLDYAPEETVLKSYEKAAYLGARSMDAGTAQAALLQSLPLGGDVNGDGVVSYVMLRGPEDHLDAIAITDACMKTLPADTTNHLTTVVSGWSLEEGRAACSGAISQFGPDIEVIFCNSPQLALGAAEAVHNRGWQPGQDMYVLAVGSHEELKAAITRQDVAGSVAVSVEKKCAAIIAAVQSMQAGKMPETYQYMGFDPVEGS